MNLWRLVFGFGELSSLSKDYAEACMSPLKKVPTMRWLASSRTGDENHWEGNPNALRNSAQRTEHMERKARTILLNYPGWETRKNPAAGEVFFLTSPCSENFHQAATLSSVTL
jgi:hypothetical protein